VTRASRFSIWIPISSCCWCRYPKDRIPHVQASSQDNGSGSRLPTGGSSGAAMCPCSSDSRLPARSSSGAVACHLGSSTTFWLRVALELPRVPRTGSAGCKQLNKYPLMTRSSWSPSRRMRAYLPRHYATRAAPRVRKACSRWPIKYRRDVWQAGNRGLSQCRVVQQLGAIVRLQPNASARGPPVSHRYGPSDATAQHRTDDRMQGDRRQDLVCPRH
jgi:hypothetical protein